jgi:hypothetical protein
MAIRTLERNSLLDASPAVEARADDDLGRARSALLRSNIYVLRKLQIDRDGDRLLLRGRVESFYHKQLAQELVRAEVIGSEVMNALQVVYTPKPDYLVESR